MVWYVIDSLDECAGDVYVIIGYSRIIAGIVRFIYYIIAFMPCIFLAAEYTVFHLC